VQSLERTCLSNHWLHQFSSHKIIEKLEKRMKQENIKLTQKKDDQKLNEMVEEMNKLIEKERIIEQQQREERKKIVEAELIEKRQSN
jgi:serine/threonine protein phosphatase PrpC